MIGKPYELIAAEICDELCQRWGQPLSVIKRENAHDSMTHLAILKLAGID